MPPTKSNNSANESQSATNAISSFGCSFCLLDLHRLSVSEREAHYGNHLSDSGRADEPEGSRFAPIDLESIPDSSSFWEKHPVPSNEKEGPSKGKKKHQFGFMKETDTFWYPSQQTSPPGNHVPGLIHVLRKGLLKGHNAGHVRRAALCVENAVLIHREVWDARWGCGYRNFLMSCAALMSQTQQPLYFPLLDSPISPSVRNLQSWIETAWNEGFDIEGKIDLEKLIGTHKWIGTADIWVAFTSRRIPAQLVDFDLTNKNQDMLINWIVEYFTPHGRQAKASNAFDSLKISSIITTDKMPLILQHDGHSRTVVGYEVNHKGVTNLLVFDPAYRPDNEVRNLALVEFNKTKSTVQDPKTSANSSLKRKVQTTITSSPNDKKLRLSENNEVKSHGSSSRIFSPLRNGLSKSDGGTLTKDPDFYGILKKFRLDPKKLEKKKQYQILYFPMTAPLSDYERTRRKEVTSIKIS